MHSRVNIPDLAFALFLVALGAFAYVLAIDLPVGQRPARWARAMCRAASLCSSLHLRRGAGVARRVRRRA